MYTPKSSQVTRFLGALLLVGLPLTAMGQGVPEPEMLFSGLVKTGEGETLTAGTIELHFNGLSGDQTVSQKGELQAADDGRNFYLRVPVWSQENGTTPDGLIHGQKYLVDVFYDETPVYGAGMRTPLTAEPGKMVEWLDLVVGASDQAPELTALPEAAQIKVGESAYFVLLSYDPEGSPLTFRTEPMGAGTFTNHFQIADTASVVFEFKGTAANAGLNMVSLIASDGMNQTIVLVTIEVTEAENAVLVYDTPEDTEDLTNSIDYDSLDEVGLTVAWPEGGDEDTQWDVFVRRGFAGPKALARVPEADASSFVWEAGAPRLLAPFQNGPNFNETYSFQVAPAGRGAGNR